MDRGYTLRFRAPPATVARFDAGISLRAAGWVAARTTEGTHGILDDTARTLWRQRVVASTADDDVVIEWRQVTVRPWLGPWHRWRGTLAADAPLPVDVTVADLRQVFTVTFQDTPWTHPDWPGVNLALVRGVLQANRRHRVADVVMAVDDGAPAALIDAALAVHERVAPLALAGESLAELGYRLADGGEAPARGAKSLRLSPDCRAEDGCKAIIGDGLWQVLRNIPCARLGHDPEGIHQLRVGVRRLRTALAVLGSLLPKQRRAFAADLRWLGGRLGDAREWDVLIAERLALTADVPSLGAARDLAERRRRAAYARARHALGAPRTTALVLRLMAWIETPWTGIVKAEKRVRLDTPLVEHVNAILRREDRRLRRLARRQDFADPERLHRVRLAAKRLRYTAEFFSALIPRQGAKAYLEALKAVQDHFGASNDNARANALLASLGLPGDGPEPGATPNLKAMWQRFKSLPRLQVAPKDRA